MVIKKKYNLSELCFFAFWFFLQLGKALGYTAREHEYITLLVLGFPFICIRLLLMRWDINCLMKSVALIILGLMITLSSGTTTYLLSIVCIVAVRGVDVRKALKMVLVVRGSLYVLRTTMALCGFSDMEVSYRYVQGSVSVVRYALGYGHPNTTQFELFMLIVVFFYLYQERLKIHHYVLALVYNYFMHQYTDSKTAYYLCIVFLVSVFMYKIKRKDLIHKIAKIVAMYSWIFGLILTVMGCLAYQYVPGFRSMGTFSSRFQTAVGLILEKKISLLGCTGVITDLGYVYLLCSGGMILFCLFFLAINKLIKSNIVTGNAVLAIAFACSAVFNIMEAYTYSVLSNCMLLFLVYVIYSPRGHSKVIAKS